MGTVPEVVEAEPRPSIDPRFERAMRMAVGGDERAALRRIILYTVVAMSLTAGVCAPGIIAVVAGCIGIAALLLLGLTDQLR